MLWIIIFSDRFLPTLTFIHGKDKIFVGDFQILFHRYLSILIKHLGDAGGLVEGDGDGDAAGGVARHFGYGEAVVFDYTHHKVDHRVGDFYRDALCYGFLDGFGIV